MAATIASGSSVALGGRGGLTVGSALGQGSFGSDSGGTGSAGESSAPRGGFLLLMHGSTP